MQSTAFLLALATGFLYASAFAQNAEPPASGLSPSAPADAAGASPGSSEPAKQLLAVVGGVPIYEDELLARISGQMRQIRNQEYTLKSEALQGMIDQKLLVAEANRRGISAGALLDQEVDAKTPEPSDEEVRAYYELQKAQINRPLDQVSAQIRQYLKQSRRQEVRENFFKSLREKSKIEVYLKPPRVAVNVDPSRIRGAADAPVTMVEFSDFQCPYCLRAYPVAKELLAKYKGKVRLAYRDFPVSSSHPEAQSAAEASRCAGEQGKFWEYHDALFEHPNQLAEAALVERASELGLDLPAFKACLASGKYKQAVQQDLQEGLDLGVAGTPAFFINGILVSGALPIETFEKTIDDELAALGLKSDDALAGGQHSQ